MEKKETEKKEAPKLTKAEVDKGKIAKAHEAEVAGFRRDLEKAQSDAEKSDALLAEQFETIQTLETAVKAARDARDGLRVELEEALAVPVAKGLDQDTIDELLELILRSVAQSNNIPFRVKGKRLIAVLGELKV